MMTTKLIPVFNGMVSSENDLLCDARTLHSFLEVGCDFSSWIKRRIRDYGFTENIDYITVQNLRSSNLMNAKSRAQKVTDYHLTLDTAKELAMVERNEKGRQIRRYFIECEKRLRENQNLPVASPSYDSRTLCYKRNGITVNELPLKDSDLIISLESWLQLANKNGWFVIRRDELASKLTGMIEQCLLTH